MKKQMAVCALILLFIVTLSPVALAAEAEVNVEAGEACDYGVDIPFTPSPRAARYTFEVFDGEGAQDSLMRAQVTVSGEGEQRVYLPLAVDPEGAHRYTLQVTAHPASERVGLDTAATVRTPFTTSPSCGCAAGTAGAFYAGAGTEGSPWRVTNQAQLAHIHSAHLAGGHSFLQVRDIRLDGSWGGIGTDIKSFTGRYDGGYHTITFPDQTLSSGLFICVVDSTITSLGIENAAISSSAARGALAAVCMGNTRITDCYALNSIVYGYAAGGLVGTAEKGSVLENCYVLGPRLNADWETGGLIGRINSGGLDLSGCYAIPASGGSPRRGSFALAGNTSYPGTGGNIYNSYWCNSPISAGVGGSVNDGGGYGTPPTLHAPSKGLALGDFSLLDNLNFDSGLWEIRTLTFNTAGGSVSQPVPVLKGFYGD
ncbi:hypothetical protein [Harryflintia acetispora]|uniref:hypothetical protein n=1 Tax=Harryflintia acetispora TaxID=1849041 RepID=UPI0018970D62|nr:hypothetical protein [Harryflintia acetispora]